MTEVAPCAACEKPQGLCVCDRVAPLSTRHEVLVLQHPQEPKEPLGTARLLALSLPRCQVRVGLSWSSLKDALGRDAKSATWAVLDPRKPTPAEQKLLAEHGAIVIDRKGAPSPLAEAKLEGFIALDGTWSQAKTLWWRNPWLLKLPRIKLAPREPSLYGALRKEPRREWVSTLEAVSDVLDSMGEAAEVRAGLRRLLRTLVQRVRDGRSSRKA